jgi:UDP-N-acetylmuramoyl-L-alanyl-D-glutamate--2,6-diaminopimelate ligase
MAGIKTQLKHILPPWVWRPLLNPFHYLESVAARIRYGFPARRLKFIGVTGTNGKSTTVNLIGSILEAEGIKIGIYSTAVVKIGNKSQDNDIDGGLTTSNPFVLHRILREMKKAGAEWIVLEVSSHALVQHRVSGIHFDATLITNLTRDHLDYHHTMEEYAAAKGKLFANKPRFMALNRDDDWYDFFDQFPAEHKISYGTHRESEARITGAKLSFKGTQLSLKLDNHDLDVSLQLPGQFNAYNATAAASLTYTMGLKLESIKKGLETFEQMPGRVQLIEEGQDFRVVIDHAHTEDALKQLFENMRMLLKGRLITVIGCDGDRDPGKREPIGKLAAEYSELVIVTDLEPYTEDPADIRATVLKGAKSIKEGVVVKENADRRKAIKQAFKFAKKGDVVLIPGLGNQHYRGMGEGKIEWDDREVAREELKKLTK